MYQPPTREAAQLGVMWRSQVKLDFSGKGDFDIDPQFRSQLPPDGDITTSITLPQSVWGGAAYTPTPELEIEANAVWINWSTFKELRIELPDGTDVVAPQNYKNTVTLPPRRRVQADDAEGRACAPASSTTRRRSRHDA